MTRQIAVFLAFTITIDKSQGMTLERGSVRCKGAFAHGKIYVALGKVRHPANISVPNFQPALCPMHPEEVFQFSGSHLLPLVIHVYCCPNRIFPYMMLKHKQLKQHSRVMRTVRQLMRKLKAVMMETCMKNGSICHVYLCTVPMEEVPDGLTAAFMKYKLMYKKTYTDIHEQINVTVKTLSFGPEDSIAP